MLRMDCLSLRSTNSLAMLAKTALHPDFTISGFPEYATGPTTLAPEQQRILRDAVIAIARSQVTLQPVAAAIIVGHADKALRKPLQERASFELDISQKRATAAAQSLIQELITQSCGAHYAKTFRYLAFGIGNAKPRHANALNEQQMRENRRIEISLVVTWLGLPHCGTN
ncbi:OmpA family protein [Paraburkholderia unamae]|uniref:OmpA family protein n=2 Tax=Paraburkholderia unamae TaxID=219649 RepID=A0ABX5KJA9_9BURK|nr:OmpA family protein [Paraburkholderia unamae]